MSEELEKLLFETIEGAIQYGSSRDNWGEFDFTELYDKVKELEEYKTMYEGLCK